MTASSTPGSEERTIQTSPPSSYGLVPTDGLAPTDGV